MVWNSWGFVRWSPVPQHPLLFCRVSDNSIIRAWIFPISLIGWVSFSQISQCVVCSVVHRSISDNNYRLLFHLHLHYIMQGETKRGQKLFSAVGIPLLPSQFQNQQGKSPSTGYGNHDSSLPFFSKDTNIEAALNDTWACNVPGCHLLMAVRHVS